MGVTQFIFNDEQLSRLFPYYVLINKDLTVDSCGVALSKIVQQLVGGNFKQLFKIAGKSDWQTEEQFFAAHHGQHIRLSLVKNATVFFEGNLEHLPQTGQYLFFGQFIKTNSNDAAAPQMDAFQLYGGDFYNKVLNEVPADIVVFDINHVYRFLNARAIKDAELRKWMIGKTDEEYCRLKEKPMSIAADRRAHFNKVIQTKQLQSWEEKLIKPDGTACYLLRNMHPVLNDQNKVDFVIGYGMDITDRKQVEEQLKINEKRYRDLYNFSPALIYTHDPEGKMLSVNPAVSAILGYSGADIIGRNIISLLPAADRDKVRGQYLNKVNTEGESKGVFRINHKTEGTKYLLYQNYKVTEGETTLYIIGFSQDITDRIKTERELLLAKHATENIAKVKETFLANMSHEIRTPMNGILGVTNLLSKTRLDEQQSNYANLISESVNNLLTIVNDILDMEKIGSGKIEFESQAFKVVDKVTSTIHSFQHTADQKNLKLVFNNDLPANLVVTGDQYRLAQVISNLLSNAIKFTQQGSISINLSLIHYSETDVIIEFSVQDTGIGINESRFGVIFDPFVQASSNTTRKFGGTGLGLSICKSLVEMQGGHITLKSTIGQGTTFTFNLPYKRSSVQMIKEVKRERANLPKIDKKILVAEDIELNQFLVKTSLESWGCTVEIAVNGLEAVKKVKEADFDLILMDIQMPEMDGITATRLIRELPEPQKSGLPIIAFTANALKGDSKQYTDAGMNDYIIKPYTEENLHEKISDVLDAHRQKASLPPLTPIVVAPEATLIVAESTAALAETEAADEQPKLYNISMIESIGKNNPSFVDKMIVMFVDIISKDFDALKDAAAKNSWDEVGQIAHKMKSTFGNMGVTSLLQYIRDLEIGAPEPQNSVQKLDEELVRVLAQLKADYAHLFGG